MSVLITTPKPYDRMIAGIEALGGKVKNQYTYINGISADIPAQALTAVQTLAGPNAVAKDEEVPHPSAARIHGRPVGGKESGTVVSTGYKSIQGIPSSSISQYANAHSGAYILNTADVALAKLHAQGFVGTGINVAVIDTGIRPGFPSLDADDSVIGGQDLVGDGNGFSNINNDGHGTFVATLISGKAIVDISNSPLLLAAINLYAPSALVGSNSIAIMGSAPSAGIYAVRVFGSDPSVGAPESRILDAIQDVITLRENYNQGKAGGVKIDICNMSFGETTLDAGRDLLAQATDALLNAGIIPVVSAGNAGPATITIAGPSSSFSAISVGAASYALNERIYNDLFYQETGMGALYRPFSGTQTAQFSSRGPNADGRPDPAVLASGNANIGQGLSDPSQVDLGIGTSYSAPIVSGVAAILRQEYPKATATQIRNAIILGAANSAIADGSGTLDEGQGVVNAQNASNLLKTGLVPGSLPFVIPPSSNVALNVGVGSLLVGDPLNIQSGNVDEALHNLKPGQRSDILYTIQPGTTQVTINLSNVNPSLPASKQNQLFGDDIFFMVHSSKTSDIDDTGDYFECDENGLPPLCNETYYPVGGTVVVNTMEPGEMRISVNGDTTNAGAISTDISISSTDQPLTSSIYKQGSISNGQTLTIPVTVPSGVGTAQFILSFNDDWSHFPTSDLDMIITDPSGNADLDGATLNAPESATVTPISGNTLQAGTWQVQVNGFDIPAGTDQYQLRILFDGKPPSGNIKTKP